MRAATLADEQGARCADDMVRRQGRRRGVLKGQAWWRVVAAGGGEERQRRAGCGRDDKGGAGS